jgi:nucleoside-diphosphate-sugar epimerase
MGSMMSEFAVTGANGFVGKALCAELTNRGYPVRAIVRTDSSTDLEGCQIIRVPGIDGTTDWQDSFQGISTIIHLAARVHVMRDDALDPLEEFRKTNVAGTVSIARAAVASGVRRLVYVSSVKVNGERTGLDDSFTEDDIPCPQDPYGVSKWEAEQSLCRIAAETGLEVVIVRSPLVYGPNVKGNFAQMLRVIEKGIPLPLGSIQNSRSLVYLGNLVDALINCATHSNAVGQTYLVSDGEDVSTPELLRQLGMAIGHPARLIACPVKLLELGGRLLRVSAQMERLLGSLRVDSAKIRRELNWIPPYSLQQGLSAMIKKTIF